MKLLRTPDDRFAGLPDWPFRPRYAEVPAAPDDPQALRIHYLDEGPPDSPPVLICTASRPGPICTGSGPAARRGRPSRDRARPGRVRPLRQARGARRLQLPAYVDWMSPPFVGLDLRDITLVCQDWGGSSACAWWPEIPTGSHASSPPTLPADRRHRSGAGVPCLADVRRQTPDFHVGAHRERGRAPAAAEQVAALRRPVP